MQKRIMTRHGTILIVEDDHDDQEILLETFQSLNIPNELLFFNRCVNAFNYLKSTVIHPLLIFCDVNLPEMVGTELRRIIFEDLHLRKRSIPFVFFTTSNNQRTIAEAYEYIAQGYFVKPSTAQELKMMLKCIFDYWSMSKHPAY